MANIAIVLDLAKSMTIIKLSQNIAKMIPDE